MDCPVCRADNDTGPQCRRCKADLVLLFTLEELRRQRLVELQTALHQEDLHRAAVLLDEVDSLRGDEDSRRLRAVLALLQGDFAAALGFLQQRCSEKP